MITGRKRIIPNIFQIAGNMLISLICILLFHLFVYSETYQLILLDKMVKHLKQFYSARAAEQGWHQGQILPPFWHKHFAEADSIVLHDEWQPKPALPDWLWINFSFDYKKYMKRNLNQMSMAKRFFTQKTVIEYKQWHYGQNQIHRNNPPTTVNNLAAQAKNSLLDPWPF